MSSIPEKPRLLLHVCCGPCATVALERLLPRFEVTMLWYNPNLDPPEEALRRLATAYRVAEHFGVDMLAPMSEARAWLDATASLAREPEGGTRCAECIFYRLRGTAAFAAADGYRHFATTLSTGPQKSLTQIFAAGKQAAELYRVEFLPESFRAEAGFQRSVELSKELCLYRQNYCGCRYSR